MVNLWFGIAGPMWWALRRPLSCSTMLRSGVGFGTSGQGYACPTILQNVLSSDGRLNGAVQNLWRIRPLPPCPPRRTRRSTSPHLGRRRFIPAHPQATLGAPHFKVRKTVRMSSGSAVVTGRAYTPDRQTPPLQWPNTQAARATRQTSTPTQLWAVQPLTLVVHRL